MTPHLRTHLDRNRYEVTLTLDPGENEPHVGAMLSDLWDDMGVVRVVSVDRAPAESALWLTPEEIERHRALVVETIETVGRLRNRGGSAE